MSSGAIEEAKCYETLLCLYGWDRDKAYRVYSELSRMVDTAEPFASYAERCGEIIGDVSELQYREEAICSGLRVRL